MLYSLEHFLRRRRLARDLLLLSPGGLSLLHAVKLFGGVFQPQLGVSVERDADVAVTHQVLQCLRIHPSLGPIAAVGMAADVRRNVGHLHPVNLIVAPYHVVEAVLPVHGHQRQAISRDILCHAMQTLSYCRIVGHVHDELIIEVSRDASLDAICEQMGKTPPWTPGIELKADGYECGFYQKA